MGKSIKGINWTENEYFNDDGTTITLSFRRLSYNPRVADV
jgi:hypothetical protein